ncbi:hypothetical protein FPZ42_07775 [Mucilaginibacter achroorhodeus]|uniref:Uncharacterized protein n=1 Tax=Mucilaginibacter achroorhodeus TaxID=2599294 RepID=A0A563U6F9_9SPHI|nr:hypothetical protein [Mucilaginibacter achroorhodeus]TWR26925.1 hypothetical protein FPZ42_07775 [Mucilaginibacter achroorhodeus]
MKTIYDFKEWLTLIDNDNPPELSELFYSVRNVESNSTFSCERLSGENYVITCSYIPVQLKLSSDKQLKYFLDYLESTYADGDIDGNEAFHRAMEKND